ncbi:RNA-directed DNA polymerase, eukaryota [Tanacetum coccineum]|uniref:RNA-directed DNA polymerase, eukaryota n=1 Tax=Tanacetum coccineum TaxID=301880 RepID=A0ABQ5ECD2_9ASTR
MISTTVYVTNFPESLSAKELFNSCKVYGHVVDSFIPTKRAKNGKRFGFVRFINVFSEERLVNNLCTVWIDRYKLHANISRFHRNNTKGTEEDIKGTGGSKNTKTNSVSMEYGKPKGSGNNWGGTSYARVLNGDVSIEHGEVKKAPAIVLDDECLMTRDLSKSLLGRVKVFTSLANIKLALCNEGFVDIKIQYMGEFWVMMKFTNMESIKKFRENVSVGSWFSIIKDASLDFHAVKRIAWVEVEGIPFKLWTDNSFKRIASKWGDLLDVDDQEDTCFHSKRLCIHTRMEKSISEEFKLIYRGKVYWIRAKETPGWVPDFNEEADDEDHDDTNSNDDGFNDQIPDGLGGNSDGEEVNEKVEKSEDPFNIYTILKKKAEKDGADSNDEGEETNKSKKSGTNEASCINIKYKEDGTNSTSSGHSKKSEMPRTRGSILGLLEEVVKVGQIMGYNMEGCMANMTEIIEAKGVEEDHNIFRKESVTKSDSFVMIRGVWRLSGQKFMIIAVYAPHDTREKQILWDYLQGEIRRWKGEVIVMGDFNEVRVKADRFGSAFNAQDANKFNAFITSSGLIEVDLGGCAFTWCHKSATKMSKLDRFLVSENLMTTCPNVNAITLERYLSDHRPILLREAYFDYGPIPFKTFHYWFDMEGFSKTVEDAWKEYPGKESNAMRYFMGKLKYLKSKIQDWNNTNRSSALLSKKQRISELEVIDKLIDNRNGGEEAVEGDENSRFFHGMLNKKRNILNVRGIIVDGVWVDNPTMVKKQFFEHFRTRFCHPGNMGANIQMEFPKKLSDDELRDIECDVTNDEIKRAVWDCETDKAPGPDGFTFGFYRRFWDLIQDDVYAAVRMPT